MTGLSLPDEAGHFMLILQRATLSRFASDNRMSGTAKENKAVVQCSIAYFRHLRHRRGQWHDLPTLRWQHHPNWDGDTQGRLVSASGNEVNSWVTPKGQSGVAFEIPRHFATTQE
jgi:hypothetical protein